MARGGERQPERRGQGAAQVEDGVGRQPPEQGPGVLPLEPAAGQRPRRPQGLQPEPGQEDRVARDPDQRPKDRRGEFVPALGEGADEAAPGPAVGPEGLGGGGQRPFEHRRPAVGQGVGGGRLGVNPLQAMIGQRHPREDGRRHAQGVDGGADVVDEAGKGQLLGPAAAARYIGPLQHHDRAAGPGQGHRRRQPVGPGPDHHRVRHPPLLTAGTIASATTRPMGTPAPYRRCPRGRPVACRRRVATRA